MISKKKLNKKLDLLLLRQSVMMEVLVTTQLPYKSAKKVEAKWNALWDIVMEDE